MRRSLAAAIGCVIVVMTALAVIRWDAWSYGMDTGTFAQVVYNAFHGFTDGPEQGTHFRFHWSPILALLWPAVAVTRSALSIQIAQTILIALSAVPLAAIVRAYAGEAWAFRAGLLALLYPPMLAASFYEFHELAFYPVIALALIWAADRARWGWFALFAIAAVLIREDVCVELVIVGLALAAVGLVKRRSTDLGLLAGEPLQPRRLAAAGLSLAALSAATLALYFFVVTPRTGAWQPSHLYVYSFANGPLQTIAAVFTRPKDAAASVVTLGRFTYLIEAFAPLAFLPFFTRWTLLALPGFAIVLLANDAIVWRMGEHYPLLWAPWLLLAAAAALVRMVMRGESIVARRWWIAAMSVCVIVLIAFDPMHPLHYLRPPYGQTQNVAQAFACVPKDAPIATHDEWFAHESLSFPASTTMRDGVERFDGYIVYTPQWKNADIETHVLPPLRLAQRAGRYDVVCHAGNVVVIRHVRKAV